MQANTSTPYYTSNKFDLTEMTALLTLWLSFMIDGLTATLYSIADWLEYQITIQLGDLHEPNRRYSESMTDTEPVETETSDPMTVTATVTIDPSDPIPNGATLTYKELQALLQQYRNERGKIKVKLNAKRDTLESEAKRLGLIA